MWIKTQSGRLMNLDNVEQVYAEAENGEYKVTAVSNRGEYENVRKCPSLEEAQNSIDYLLSILDADKNVCHMDGVMA